MAGRSLIASLTERLKTRDVVACYAWHRLDADGFKATEIEEFADLFCNINVSDVYIRDVMCGVEDIRMVLFQGEDSLVKLALAVKTCVRAIEDHPGCSEVFIRTMDRFVGSCVNWITLSVAVVFAAQLVSVLVKLKRNCKAREALDLAIEYLSRERFSRWIIEQKGWGNIDIPLPSVDETTSEEID